MKRFSFVLKCYVVLNLDMVRCNHCNGLFSTALHKVGLPKFQKGYLDQLLSIKFCGVSVSVQAILASSSGKHSNFQVPHHNQHGIILNKPINTINQTHPNPPKL